MGSSPGKRSPRKTGVTTTVGATGPQQPPLVDPETVAKVRYATARSMHVVVSTARTTWHAIATATVFSATWLWPRVSKLAVWSAGASWRGLGIAARWLWSQRKGLMRLGHRGLWWGALAILLLVGRALLSADGDPELVEVATLWLGAGLSMSVLVLLGAPEPRMRVAAFALAGGHGSLALLAWIAVAGA
jgi:hypothetical protein